MPAKHPRMALVIDAPTKEKVAFLASKHRRSTSAEIVVAIEAWVKQHADDMAGFEPSEPDSEA
jgi:predicted transcriptional regulator